MNLDELLDDLAMELGEWPSVMTIKKEYEGWDWANGDHHPHLISHDKKRILTRDNWLQRRAELINCPPDSEAPSWARWRMQGPTGQWHWAWATKPSAIRFYSTDFEGWKVEPDCSEPARKGAIPNGHRWQDTLTEVNTMTTTAHEDQFSADQPHEADARQLDEQLERDIATFQSACHEAAKQTEREFGLPNANSILNAAEQHMEERAATYDKPQGERSMRSTVDAFSAITGHHLSEEQGWLFMQLLKAVRSQQGAYRADSYEDGAAYVALAGEAAAKERS